MPIAFHALLSRLFPICRSITGAGVRQTLAIIREVLPSLCVHEVPSGTQVFDWIVPDEWNIRSARLTGPDGEKVADFADHTLHVMGYSEPVDCILPLEELTEHLHSREDYPDAIPYVTSYYQRRWGFCLKHRDREKLKPGLYHARIDSTLAPGSLTYGELVIPGRSREEVLLSTYTCHPSLANDNLSGPVVAVGLAKWLMEKPRKYTYRILFIPETIGSITYLARNLEHLKKHVAAGFILTCLGDERAYSYLPSRAGSTLADQVTLHILKHFAPEFKRYSFLDRGSDERQYCSPGVDLPVCSILRSKYGQYPEYHTSLDDLTLVTEAGLRGGYEIMRKCLETLELNMVYAPHILCEPQLGRRGVYPTLSVVKGCGENAANIRNILAYVDGVASLLDIAETIGLDIFACAQVARELAAKDIIQIQENTD